MAIFNGNALLAAYKSSNYFYVAGRNTNEYNSFQMQRSVDGKTWESVNTDSFGMVTLNSISEVGGMLVASGVGPNNENLIILSNDDFATIKSYPLPYNVMQLEFAGGNNLIGSARLSNDSFVSPVFIIMNGLNTAPKIVIRLPSIKISDWSNENTLFTNSDNSITFYDGSTVYKSTDGLAWTSVTGLSVYWLRKHGDFYYYRIDEQDTVNWSTKNTIYKTSDFLSVDIVHESVNKNPTPVSKGFQDNDDLVIWDIGTTTAYWFALDGTKTTVTTSGIPTNTYPDGYMINQTTGRRVMFGYSNQYYSDDGKVWTSTSFTYTLKKAYFYDGKFIAIIQNGPYDAQMYFSTDGISWNQVITPEDFTGSAYIGFGFAEYNGELLFYKTSGSYANIFWKTSDGITWTVVNDYPNPNLTYASVRLLATDKLNAFIKLDNATILKTKAQLSDASWAGMSDELLSNPISAQALGSDRDGTVYFGPQYSINKNDPITKTSDAGITFTTFNYPTERSQASSRMVTKIDGILYATGTEYDEQGNAEIGLFKSTDWNTWERIPVNVGGNFRDARFSNMYISYDSHKWAIACVLSQFYAASQILVASYNQVDWTMKTLNSTDQGAFEWKVIPEDANYVQLNVNHLEFTDTIALGRNNLGKSTFSSTMSSNAQGTLWESNDVNNPEYDPEEFYMPVRGSGEYFVSIGRKTGTDVEPNFIFSTTGKDWFSPANPLLIDPYNGYNTSPIVTTADRIYLFYSVFEQSSTGGPNYSNVKMYTYNYSGQQLAESMVDEMTSSSDSVYLNPSGMSNGILWTFTNQNRLAYSTDYVNWNIATLDDGSQFIDYQFTKSGYVAAGPNKIILMGNNGKLLVSEDNMATWSDYDWMPSGDPAIEYYAQTISYSNQKSKYFITYSTYNGNTGAATYALIESIDGISWTEVTLPDFTAPGVPYYYIKFESTTNYDMLLVGDNNSNAIGVWLLTDSGWVESDLGDSLNGYYVGGNFDNVPPFRGLMVNTDEKSTLIICSASGSGPET